MSRNAGYKIIDFQSLPFTSGQEASLEGIYNQVRSTYGKATLISGLVVADVVYPDFFAPFMPNENNYSTSVVIGGKTLTINITSDDNITVTAA